MKKTLVLFAIIASIAACNSNDSKTAAPGDSGSAGAAAAGPEDPEAKKGLDLVAKNDCFTCHKVADQYTGPAYVAVSEKYKGADEAMVDTLAQRIIKGSVGHWGSVPMIPHPGLPQEDAKSMVKYVLSLQK